MKPEVAIAPRAAPRLDWRNARSERDFEGAEAAALTLLARRPDDHRLRRSHVLLLESQGRSAEAVEHWAILRDADGDDFEAAFHLARAALARGFTPVEAAAEAAPAANEHFRQAIVEVLSEPTPALDGEFRHVAVSGVAYSGSTLLDRVLGGLPSVKSIGESHWITKVHRDGRYQDMTLSEPLAAAKFVPCTVCGARCEVLSPTFRRSMAADNADWYRRIAARLGTPILVSADKNLPKLVDKDPDLDLSALVVFKSPTQAWRSHLDKLPADRSSEFYDAECSKYLDQWAKAYSGYLHHFWPQDTVAFLNFDAFARQPEPLLRAVCAALDLPFDASVLERTVPGHAIGGNARAMRRLREKDYGVDITPLADPQLEPSQAKIVADHVASQDVFRELTVRHDATARSA